MKFLFSRKARKERQRLKDRTDLLKYVLQDKNIPGNISGAVSGPLLDVFTYTPCTGIVPSQKGSPYVIILEYLMVEQ